MSFSSYPRKRLASLAACGLAVTGVASLALLAGCGGKSSSSSSTPVTQTGRAKFTVQWPDTASRLIPTAANSVVVTLTRSGTTLATQVLASPGNGGQTTATINNLPVGDISVTIEARPNADGTGTPQASAATTITVASGQTTAVGVTLASTINSLSVSPVSTTITAGATAAISTSALNSAGNIVLTAPSKITYVSSNTGVATVDSSGTITAVAAGSATITVTETESGKTAAVAVTVNAVATPTPTPTPATGSTIVDLANAYIATLSDTQKTATVGSFVVTNAVKWSNLPATPNSDGTTTLRNGIAYSTLTTAQQTAWNNLVNAVLTANSSNGLNQFNSIRASDNALRTNYSASGYSGDYQYLAFVGTPSTTGQWIFQVGGHHNAHNYYFTGNTLSTTTPYHIGAEPTTFTLNGTSYTPLADQIAGVTNLLKSFSTAQLTSAKLSGSFSDLYLGAGQDARANFPTGTTGRGILVNDLSDDQKALVKAAINAWVKNNPNASTYQALYESELASTYVGYAGNSSAPTTVFTTQGDYLRIDGPHVWIEFVSQGGVVVQGQIHYHTIWRDRVTDYNAETAGFTLTNSSTGGGGGGGNGPGGGGPPGG